jgi:DNA-binding transcriptional LysR family regulator
MDVVLDDRIIDLIEEGVDVALRMGTLADSTSLSARKLASGPHHVLGTPTYFARSGVPVTPAELAGHAAVIYTRQGAGTWCFRQGATEVSITVSGPLRVKRGRGRTRRRAGGYGPDHHFGVDVRSGLESAPCNGC